MDFSKLSPAPWIVSGKSIICPLPDPARECSTETDLEFAALARNVADILIRRKWGIRVTQNGFSISNTLGMLPDDGGFNEWLDQQEWPHPFVAVKEADDWMKQHVDQACKSEMSAG